MNMTSDSLYPDDWKKAAVKDWKRIAIMIKTEDAEGAAFFLQQAIEKYLKGFLLARGWKLRKIHDLSALLDEAIAFAPALEKFRGLCERVKGYYFTERYPIIVPSGLTLEDIENDKTETEQMLKILVEE